MLWGDPENPLWRPVHLTGGFPGRTSVLFHSESPFTATGGECHRPWNRRGRKNLSHPGIGQKGRSISGITQEELADIRKEVANYEEDGKKYVALVNISARLHTLYKGHADFHIDSSLNGGTRIILKLPLEEVNKTCIV